MSPRLDLWRRCLGKCPPFSLPRYLKLVTAWYFRILSIRNLKKAGPFILHFALTIVVAFVTLYLIDSPSGDRIYNLNNRRPRFTDLDGGKTIASIKSSRPLQSDITTALSIAASATRAAAAVWAGKLLWRCAFMFMEKGEITIAGFSKIVDGGITTLLWPRDVANRKNVFLIYLIIFTCFGMDYFSSILTGSVTWQPTFTLVGGFVPVVNITEGAAGQDISPYRNESVVVSDTIERGAALALVSWGNLNTNSSYLTLPSNLTRRAIIQWADTQTVQILPIGSTMDTIRLPYFKVNNFKYIADPEAVLSNEQISLLNDSSIYNPYIKDQGFAAFLPDASWGPGSNPNLPEPTNVSESRILSIRVLSPTDSNCTSPFSDFFIPSNVNFYPTLTANSTRYSCFAFANVTYTAGGAVCQNCKIVSPAVVEGNIDDKDLQPVPDPLTVEALAIAPSVGTHTLLTVFADVTSDISTPLNSLAIEFVSRAYQSAWSSLVLSLGYIGPNNQTSVSFALPASHPTVTRWRVYVWAGLQLTLLLCGVAFAYWQSHFRHPWFSDPTMIAFQLDTARIFQQGAVAPKDPWDPDAEYPAGKLQLEDYDHQRPGQPRAVTLIQRNVKYTELENMETKPSDP